jgi:4'-phosphopantetheinyl transferase
MPLLLYATEFPQSLPDEVFRDLLDRLPIALRPKILRYRRWEDAHAALLGKLLLLLALQDIESPAGLYQLCYSPLAKPYFTGGPHFNISHSGNRAVCALSTAGRIGVDIEAIKPMDFDDFKTQFSQREWTAIRSAPDPIAAFYRFWTAKESLIKADGRGMEIPLLQLDVTEYRPVHFDGTTWSFHPLFFFPGYAAHLSTEAEAPDAEMTFREISPAAITERL